MRSSTLRQLAGPPSPTLTHILSCSADFAVKHGMPAKRCLLSSDVFTALLLEAARAGVNGGSGLHEGRRSFTLETDHGELLVVDQPEEKRIRLEA